MKTFSLLAVSLLFSHASPVCAETYSAKVVPLIQTTINSGTDADYNGRIKYVASVGDILKPAITDMSGKVIEPGSPLVILDPLYWQDIVQINKIGVTIAENDFENARINLDRNNKLIKNNEISEKEYQNYLNTYKSIKNSYQQAKYSLSKSIAFLDACSLIAPFECIVDKVLLTSGLAAGQPPTIVISQLNPIGIKIKMSRSVADSITSDSVVKIFSNRKKEPVGFIRGSSILQDDGVILKIYNCPEYGKTISINGNTIPVVTKIAAVENFRNINGEELLGVPFKSIFSDKNGKYVLRGKGMRHMDPDNKFSSIFNIEKVYVKLANMKKKIAGNTVVVALQNNKKLQLFDVVIAEKHPELKDNSQLFYAEERYIFMPGDTIKVVIEK